MTTIKDFPEVVRRNQGNDGENFLFWLQRVGGNAETRVLMFANKDGFSEAQKNGTYPEQDVIPVYLPLFNDNTCVRNCLA